MPASLLLVVIKCLISMNLWRKIFWDSWSEHEVHYEGKVTGTGGPHSHGSGNLFLADLSRPEEGRCQDSVHVFIHSWTPPAHGMMSLKSQTSFYPLN